MLFVKEREEGDRASAENPDSTTWKPRPPRARNICQQLVHLYALY